MIDKRVYDFDAALEGMADGATIMSSGFGAAGAPQELLEAVLDCGFRDLVIISNNAGEGERGLIKLLKEKRIAKVICSFPTSSNSEITKELYAAGLLELEIVPQGTLSERMRAGGAGIGGFYTRTSVDTPLAEGKESRSFEGIDYVLERPLTAQFAFIKAREADRWGNLTYNLSARNFGPTMAMAADTTIVQVDQIVELGDIDPEQVVTPGIYVDRIIEVKGG
ncbi:MAG: 3-oxoadipate CoA-transferase [Rhodospirillaceae bacterium]|nr:3-oxoadipate CoA-transferase [Rhodospirillaceae bacterium]|tara:strand:+ start:1289 stop:1957 length:669 start_codon:yes stop_codon:yes gene_type:complete